MSTPRPLIVRLRNWVGDVLLGLPALERLQAAGYELHLIGKPWAAELLAGHGWPVHKQPKSLRERVALLRRLRHELRQCDPGFDRRINAVAFPYSFGSALDMRLAGLRAIGHNREARGWLLGRSVPRPDKHELEVYWHLASALLEQDAPLPERLGLRVTERHHEAAEALCAQHGLARGGFIVICPFAGGTFAGQNKVWPDFPAFAADELRGLGLPVVICPGPGEEDEARSHYPQALCLERVNLGVLAALLQRAALLVSNDTGPGHLAAAVEAPLLSVLGPTDPALWRAWGPTVHIVQGPGQVWPARAAVRAQAVELLAR